MRLRYVIPTLSLLAGGCGGSGIGTPVTPPGDASAQFLPVNANASNGSLDSRSTGLFVFSSRSPQAPPKQITTEPVTGLSAHVQHTVDAQGIVTAGRPDELFYATLDPSGNNHVWLLDVTGTSSLVPKQLSNLTLPYYMEHLGPGANGPVVYCRSQAISKNLTDPASVLLFLSVPTSSSPYCTTQPATTRWYLLHSSDGPAAAPVDLPLLSSEILPLYSPTGALAGLVAVDAANNLNFYADETLANPHVLLTNVRTILPLQEHSAGNISSNPTYSFLEVVPTGNASAEAIYRIDYTGVISGALYSYSGFVNGAVVESNTLYLAKALDNTEQVVRVPGDGTASQVLSNVYTQQAGWLPALKGVSGANLVFSTATSQQQWMVQTLTKGAPGTITTLRTYDGVTSVDIAGGDILVTAAKVSSDPVTTFQWSTQIMDGAGTDLQALTPSSNFISAGTPVVQVRDITATDGGPGGGTLFSIDLSQPSAPVSTALKTAGGAAFSFPSGTPYVYLFQVTPTLDVGEDGGGGLIVDLTRHTVVPVSIPNATISFVMNRLVN